MVFNIHEPKLPKIPSKIKGFNLGKPKIQKIPSKIKGGIQPEAREPIIWLILNWKMIKFSMNPDRRIYIPWRVWKWGPIHKNPLFYLVFFVFVAPNVWKPFILLGIFGNFGSCILKTIYFTWYFWYFWYF